MELERGFKTDKRYLSFSLQPHCQNDLRSKLMQSKSGARASPVQANATILCHRPYIICTQSGAASAAHLSRNRNQPSVTSLLIDLFMKKNNLLRCASHPDVHACSQLSGPSHKHLLPGLYSLCDGSSAPEGLGDKTSATSKCCW